MKIKKLLALVLALLTVGGTGLVNADGTDYPIGYYNIVYANRYLIFAADEGSYIKTLELPVGTVVDVNNYVPTKVGYIFDGWYSDPRTKELRVGTITLAENITVYAKWIDDGTPKLASVPHDYATNAEIMQYGNYIDAVTGAPVTALWMEQRARLDALMQEYDAKFNS